MSNRPVFIPISFHLFVYNVNSAFREFRFLKKTADKLGEKVLGPDFVIAGDPEQKSEEWNKLVFHDEVL
jgi:hypothetical protein